MLTEKEILTKHYGEYGNVERARLRADKKTWQEMLAAGTLDAYLTRYEDEKTEQFLNLVDQLAKNWNVTEELKKKDPVAWTREMNMVRMSVREMLTHV